REAESDSSSKRQRGVRQFQQTIGGVGASVDPVDRPDRSPLPPPACAANARRTGRRGGRGRGGGGLRHPGRHRRRVASSPQGGVFLPNTTPLTLTLSPRP